MTRDADEDRIFELSGRTLALERSVARGVGGAEGTVWLAVFGTEQQLEKAQEVVASVRGEPAFTDA